MPAKTKPDPTLLANLQAAAASLSFGIQSEQMNGKGKTFEAWSLVEIALRLTGLPGIHVEAVGHDSAPVSKFRFRGAPGHIPMATASGIQPSHFRVWRDSGAIFELHMSLEHMGESATAHELDISVLSGDDADMIRNSSGGVFQGYRVAALELKDYKSNMTLPKSIPRALLGAAVDLDIGVIVKGFWLATRLRHHYLRSFRAPQYWLLTSAAIGTESRAFLDAYSIGHESHVGPNNDIIFDGVAEEIANRLW